MKRLIIILMLAPLSLFGQRWSSVYSVPNDSTPFGQIIGTGTAIFQTDMGKWWKADTILTAIQTIGTASVSLAGGGASDSSWQSITTDTIFSDSTTVFPNGINIPYLANSVVKVLTIDTVGNLDTTQTAALSDYFANNTIQKIRVDSIDGLRTINEVATGNVLYVDGATGYVGGKTVQNIEAYVFDTINVGSLTTGKARVVIDTIGGVRLYNSATAWDDLRVSPTQLKSVGVADRPDFNVLTLTLDFPINDTTEIAGYVYQLPHRWKEGSDIEIHLHVEHDTTGTPVFAVQYQWINPDGNIPTTWTKISSTGFVYARSSGEKIHNMIEFPTISGAGKTISSILKVRIYRTDNSYVGDCRVLEVDVHYQVDSFGSQTEHSK